MWDAMKPLPPVRRTVGFGDGPVMITRAVVWEDELGLAEVYGNGLEKEGDRYWCWDAGIPVPLT